MMATHPPTSTGFSGSRRVKALDVRPGLYFTLRLAGFLSTNLLATWGLFVLFFIVIGGLSFEGLLHQLDNLTSRFVAADADRIADFRTVVLTTNILLFAGIAVLRRHSLLPLHIPRWSHRHG